MITGGIGIMDIRIEIGGGEGGLERTGTSYVGKTGGVPPRTESSASESELLLSLGGVFDCCSEGV